jgi:hypothetical protein
MKVVEEIKIYILYSIIFFSENRAVYEIMWKNILEQCRSQVLHMPISWWVSKATQTQTHTHTHTHTVCNTYYFFSAAIFVKARLSIT